MSGSGRGREVGLVLGVSVVALAIMSGIWSFVRAPEPGPKGKAAVHAPSDTDPEGSEGSGEPEGSSRRLIENYEVFAPKDPFEPLLAGQGGSSYPVVRATGEGVVTTDFDNGPASAGFHHRIKVVQVDRGSAIIGIDGTDISVREGEVFAERFQLLSLADDCATMLFGDDQFTLCEGEEIHK